MTDFRKLSVWHKAHRLSLRAEEVAKRVARRKPGLAKQLERAADSVPAAIAEGRGRGTDADFAHYVSMAIASVTEVENHLQRGFDGGVIPKPDYEELTEGAIEVRRMLIGLRRTLRGEPRPPPTSEEEPGDGHGAQASVSSVHRFVQMTIPPHPLFVQTKLMMPVASQGPILMPVSIGFRFWDN